LRTLHGWDIRTTSAQYTLYFATCILLLGCILASRYVLSTRIGRVLLAMRDREDRVRFSGYDVASFKVFTFCMSAAISGIGGALFVLQVGFMSPSLVGIVPSIEMVIFAAVGGKMSLLGAVYGTLLVNTGKSLFSENFPQLWLFFIAVVMLFPNGLAGIWVTLQQRLSLAKQRRQSQRPVIVVEEIQAPGKLAKTGGEQI
jgi:urea transport system permease protein